MESLTRRRFLRQAASAAALTALGPLAEAFAASGPSDLMWRRFAETLRGNLLRPGNSRYGEIYPPFNKRYLSIRPAAIAIVRSLRDVRECVRFARDQGIPITARAGGHSYAGYSTSTGLIVDFRRMRAIDLNAGAATATLQAGARNEDIVRSFSGGGFTIPAGRCPTVAVSGLTLGGGFGFSSRHLGLTADRLLSTDVVTADGDVLHCSEKENADLFWALRGGGGGNFGINTRFRFQLAPVGNVAIYKVAWDFRDAPAILEAMQKLIADAPAEFSMRLGMGATGKTRVDTRANAEISMLGQYFGSSAKLREILDPLIKAGRTTQVYISNADYWQAQRFFYKTAPINRFAVKSHYIRDPLTSAGIQTLVQGVQRRPGSSNRLGGGVTFFGWGGRINQVAPDATAFVHRDAILLMELDTGWTGEDAPHVAEANLDWLQTLSGEIRPHVSPYAYQNFIDPTLKTWRFAYYGRNYDRLVSVKRRYDRNDLFRFKQGIGA
ncbi:MAG: FAD-binding oxidoreductase [Chthoniobacterales bacterium]